MAGRPTPNSLGRLRRVNGFWESGASDPGFRLGPRRTALALLLALASGGTLACQLPGTQSGEADRGPGLITRDYPAPAPNSRPRASELVDLSDPGEIEGGVDVDSAPPVADTVLLDPVYALPEMPPAVAPSTDEPVDAPGSGSPPLVSRFLTMVLPMELMFHQGDEVVSGTIEDLFVDGDRVVAMLASIEGSAGRRRRVVATENLRWGAVVDAPNGLGIGIRNPEPDSSAALDMQLLFDGQALFHLEGRLIGMTEVDAHSLMLKVHDNRNLVHRVLVEPCALVKRELPGLVEDMKVAVEGIETRDGAGKLLVASALGTPQGTLALRDSRGEVLWDRLTESLLSMRELLDLETMNSSDGVPLEVAGLVLDGESNTVFLSVQFEGHDRVVPLPVVASAPDGGWGVLLDRAGLEQLQELPTVGVEPDAMEEAAAQAPVLPATDSGTGSSATPSDG